MLTQTVAGRVYDYSHSVGRGSQSGMGFNQPVAAAIGEGDVVYVLKPWKARLYRPSPGTERVLAPE